MELQQRDKDILTLCYEQRFLLIKHISQYYFKSNYSEAKRRVRELKKANLLREAGARLGRNKVLELTKEGRKLADSYSRIGPLPRYDLDPATLEHNAYVTEARLLIQKRWEGHWVPEHALRVENPREIPDGIFIFEETENEAIIEVENSLKGRKRFESRIRSWFHGRKTVLVIFIATSNEIYNNLARFLEKAPERPAHIVMTLEDLNTEEPGGWSPHIGDVAPFKKAVY